MDIGGDGWIMGRTWMGWEGEDGGRDGYWGRGAPSITLKWKFPFLHFAAHGTSDEDDVDYS